MASDNGDDLARRLIDEAARLLAEQGPAGLSLRKVAAAAGTSTMAIYSLFGDKPRLLAAMYQEGFRRLGERLQMAEADPASALVQLGRAYRLAALENPHLYALMFGPPPPGLHLNEENDKAASATYAPLEDAVRHAVEDGTLAGDPQRIALQFWAMAHGLVSLELAGQLPLPSEDAAQRFDDALMYAAWPFLTSE